ncbi:MAG: peptidase domain-containing ABC transporter, partial [Alphaproteobacteria bacterium]|nr:peptidase domain-containing ABC transporter [Alphaproteobacteria bacterium]
MESERKEIRDEWLMRTVSPLMGTFHEILVISLFLNIVALAAPIFVMQVYDRVVFHAGVSTLAGLVLGMITIVLFDYVLRQTRSRVLQTVALRVDVEIGRKLFDTMTALPLRTLESRPAHYWQILFHDVDTIRNTLSGATALMVADLPFAVLFLVIVMLIAKPIVWVLLASVVMFFVLAWWSGRVVGASGERERKAVTSRDTVVSEAIAARTSIKALAMERSLRPIWEESLASTIEQSVLRGSRSDGFSNAGAMITVLTTVTMVSVGALAIIAHDMTMGSMVAANMLSGKLLSPLNQLVGTWRTITAFRQSLQRLGAVFSEETENQTSHVGMERPKGLIKVENALFRYSSNTAPALEGANLTFTPGTLTAIVGRNGSGKTTLLKVVLGLYRPETGRVLLDGADMAQFTRHELAGWIGYVPQEHILFTGTIRDNIEHGDPNAGDAQIIHAAQMAGVHSLIIDFPDGYGTDVGEGGARLSGGMRQRIALARALVGNPPVLVLDEPSANLDRQAESDLRTTLLELA